MRRGVLIAVAWLGGGLVGCGPVILEAEGDPKPALSRGMDPVTLQGLALSGDLLEVDTAYGGGCAKHSFWLEWDGAFLESSPVQVRLELRHDARDDRCLAFITSDKRRFDLTPLKEAWREGYRQQQGSISISVTGAPGSVLYTF